MIEDLLQGDETDEFKRDEAYFRKIYQKTAHYSDILEGAETINEQHEIVETIERQ